MTTVTFDSEFVKSACNTASQLAKQASTDATPDGLGNSFYGECGFAWVDVYGVRSNSKLGLALQRQGFKRSYSGTLQLWNPSGLSTQSMHIKEVGAIAYATALRNMLGLDRVYAGTRLD